MGKEINIDFDYSSVRGSTELHNKFKKEFMISCSWKYENVMILPYDVGFFRAWSNPDVPVRCGKEGVFDTIVIIPNHTLWFDMKTGKATLQQNQKNFKNRLKQIKGYDVAFKVSSVREALNIIEEFMI